MAADHLADTFYHFMIEIERVQNLFYYALIVWTIIVFVILFFTQLIISQRGFIQWKLLPNDLLNLIKIKTQGMPQDIIIAV